MRPHTPTQERYHPYRTQVYNPHVQLSETKLYQYHQSQEVGPDYQSQTLPNRLTTRDPRPRRHRQTPRHSTNTPICHRCKKPGHIRRNCPVTLAQIAIGQEVEEQD